MNTVNGQILRISWREGRRAPIDLESVGRALTQLTPRDVACLGTSDPAAAGRRSWAQPHLVGMVFADRRCWLDHPDRPSRGPAGPDVSAKLFLAGAQGFSGPRPANRDEIVHSPSDLRRTAVIAGTVATRWLCS